MVQYDVNVFVIVDLNEEVFMQMPLGYRESAPQHLFGLRRSPILWQKKLANALVTFTCASRALLPYF
jgi:hypothetical protein